ITWMQKGILVNQKYNKLIKNAPVNIDRYKFVIDKTRGKTVLDLGCIAHSLKVTETGPWLHKEIKKVAKTVVGVDVLEAEVKMLREKGYNIVCQNVESLGLQQKFDVIVCGDIIEHLFNVGGFLGSLYKHLDDNGIVIITTCNPFYVDQFLFCLLKGFPLVNPSHVCWYDPYTLFSCAERFGFNISGFYWLKDEFSLAHLATLSSAHQYDVFNQQWVKNTFYQKVYRKMVTTLFRVLYNPIKAIMKIQKVLHSSFLIVLTKEHIKST
ncbi:unnamed protein product, partial [marine sediment metagenome]